MNPRKAIPRTPAPPPGRKIAAVRGGFSLVEVVLALGIISFAIVGLLGITVVGTSASLDSKRDTEAGQIFEQIVGQLRTKPFDQEQGEGNPSDAEVYPLPALDENGSITFFLDDQNRVVSGDQAVHEVQVRIGDPAAQPYLDEKGATQPVPSRNNLSLVTVTIFRSPHRANDPGTVYHMEICPLQQ